VRPRPPKSEDVRTGIYDLRSNTAGTLGIPLTETAMSAAKQALPAWTG